MKKFQYIVLATLLIGFSACEDWMNTVPEGATKTADQKSKAEAQNDAAAQANVNAMYAQMIALYPGLSDYGYERHNDFGYAAVCMFTEANGQDFVSPNIGYNWFSNSQYPQNRENTLTTTDGLVAHLVWNTYYKIINAANNVISTVADPANAGSQEVGLCQAYCVRAFCYMQLAQLYQFPYKGNENAKCVPLVVPNMTSDQQLNNPRKTVQEVYDLIKSDLDYACNSKAFAEFVRSDNGYCNQAVAYGLRARMNLLQENNTAAAEDAKKALTLSGATPLSIAECNKPGFADGSEHNVLWANIVVETNDIVQTGIINYPSHMSTLYTDGYTGVGACRAISSELYSKINTTDVRKGWWLNDGNESPLFVGNYAAIKDDVIGLGVPYVNLKFGTADGNTSGTAAAASDWIIMRAEEMYLIIAEATQDAAYLQDFVRTYRDPSYLPTGNVTEDVWLQRRIELWGEGFAFQDLLRLKKGITRTTSTNWPAAWIQDIPADYKGLLWRIPESEIEANQGISDADNNPYVNI